MTEKPSAVALLESELTRLRRRVERERAARLEAEAIAEDGLRALYEVNRNLDQRVQERVAESERLAKHAARAERVKDEILASLSHELRTPLMAVIGSLDLIDLHDDDKKNYLITAKAAAVQLRQLVSDLFELVEIESGERQTASQATDVHRFIEQLADQWRMRALHTGLLLVTSVAADLKTILLDAERLYTALNRLIDNAIKYSESGNIILSAERSADDIVFVVSDQGPGIEAEHLSRLLQPFEVGDRSSTRSTRGAGLGLAISRGLVEIMDGEISIESEVGVGTRVTVTVPVGGLGLPNSSLQLLAQS